MAKNINIGGDKVSRGHLYMVPASKINFDSVQFNGRYEPVSDEAVRSMAESFKRYGQVQPVEARRRPDNSLELTMGFTRLRAALLIEQEDPEFKLKVLVTDCNEREAFERNVVENLERNATTPIDDAHNIRKLMDKYAYTNKDVQALYGKSHTWVNATLTLLNLPDDVRRSVARGEITRESAIQLAKMDGSKAAAILAEAKAETDTADDVESDTTPAMIVPEGHDDEAISKAIEAKKAKKRKKLSAKVVNKARTNGVKSVRNASDLRKLLATRTDPVSVAILDFLTGDADESAVFEALDQVDSLMGQTA